MHASAWMSASIMVHLERGLKFWQASRAPHPLLPGSRLCLRLPRLYGPGLRRCPFHARFWQAWPRPIKSRFYTAEVTALRVQGVLCDRCRELSSLPRVHVQAVRHCWLSDWYAYCRDGRSSCHALAFAQSAVTIGVALRAVGIAENAFSLGVLSFGVGEQLAALRASLLVCDLHSASPSMNRTSTATRSRASALARLRDSQAMAWRTSFHSSSATLTT